MINHRQMPMPLRPKVKHVWAHGFLIGLFFGVLVFFVYFYTATISCFSPAVEKTSRTIAEAQSEPTSTAKLEIIPTTPVESVFDLQQHLTQIFFVDLQQNLTQIFNGIKETNQGKNLERLMGFYSPKFPGLSKKTRSFKQSWKLYDYQKMEFKIHELNLLAEDSVVAWVTWDVTLKELSTSKIKNVSKTYKVTFIKEADQWSIIELKDALW